MANGRLKQVFKRPRRVALFRMRLLVSEKESVRAAARAVGRSMTQYLLALHEFAVGADKRHG